MFWLSPPLHHSDQLLQHALPGQVASLGQELDQAVDQYVVERDDISVVHKWHLEKQRPCPVLFHWVVVISCSKIGPVPDQIAELLLIFKLIQTTARIQRITWSGWGTKREKARRSPPVFRAVSRLGGGARTAGSSTAEELRSSSTPPPRRARSAASSRRLMSSKISSVPSCW